MKQISRNGLWASWIILLLLDLSFRGWLWLMHTVPGIRFLANYLLSAVGLLTLLYLLSFIRKKAVFWIFYTLLVIVPMLFEGAYFNIYEKFLSPSAFSIFSESPDMVLGTWMHNLNIPLILYILLFSTLSGIFLKRYRPRRIWVIVPDVLIFLTSVIFLLFHWYSVNNFQHSTIAFYNGLTENLLLSKNETLHPDRMKLSSIVTKKNAPNFVFVVGESQVLSHMSLYGYHRKTTPLLDSLYQKKKIIPFYKAVSIGNKTRLSVPYMLIGLEGPDPKGVSYLYPTIFDYMKAAGYHTLFISAQDLHWGNLDKLFDDGHIDLLEDGSFFSSHVNVHKGADDLVVLPYLYQKLDKYGSPFLLVVQMDGSHYPYDEHSPDSLKKFLPEESPNCVNAYDNTLIVTDKYLAYFYQYLHQHFPNTYMFFTPDHGQNFGGLNGHFNDNFTPDVYHNALIVFPPTSDSIHYKLILKNQHRLTSQADIFATILDLAGIRPQYHIDGRSMLDTVYSFRLVTCSEYMPTFHNNPIAVVVDSALQTKFVDFSKESVTDFVTGKDYRYNQLDPKIKQIIDYRLSRAKPAKEE